MIRVTVVEATLESARLRVEGRLMGPWVAELQQSCDVNALSDGIELDLDIGDLSFVDVAGIELLKSLRGRGVNLLRVPLLVAGQLREP
jgi:RNA polymerase sigma-70 factor, ECF subfamily